MGPSAELPESLVTHVNCVGQTKFFVSKQFEIRSFVCSDRIDISLPKVNSINVNLRPSQTHPSPLCNRQLPRSASRPPNVNVNSKSSRTHLSQLRDRLLPRPVSCPPNANINLDPQMSTRLHDQLHNCQLPKPKGCLPNVKLQPDVNLRPCQKTPRSTS